MKRKLCSFTIEGVAPLHGGEAIRPGLGVAPPRPRLWLHIGQDHRLRLPAAELAAEQAFEIEAFGMPCGDARAAHALRCEMES